MAFLKDRNRRRYKRTTFSDTIVINPMGACEVAEMSSGGFSFQCLFEHSLSGEWTVDILNNSGVYIHKFPVERVWQTKESSEGTADICGLTVGVRFKNLTSEQQSVLDELVQLNELNQSNESNPELLPSLSRYSHFTSYGSRHIG